LKKLKATSLLRMGKRYHFALQKVRGAEEVAVISNDAEIKESILRKRSGRYS
jgi:hypothetical protein